MAQETNFDPKLLGADGEIGLLQVMPKVGANYGVSVKDLWDPATNIRISTTYLRYLIGRFGSTRAALVAYNGGEGNVEVLGQNAKRLARARMYADRIQACAEKLQPLPLQR